MPHPKPIHIGQSDFRELRRANAYYVDKSLFIEQVITAAAQVMLLPRPRRFGKTLNLSMLRYFFEQTDEDNAPFFDELAIQATPLFEPHQGQYPVIYMTLKDVKSRTWGDCLEALQTNIYDLYAYHRYLVDSDLFYKEEKAYIQNILNKTSEKTDYEQALKKLSDYLHRYHQQKVVILIDEYDTPIQSGYSNNYYEDVISFMRNFLSGGLKDNPHLLFKGVLTGILRVAKESIFSGLNNLGVYTLLSAEFNTAFGFTETEVEALLKSYRLVDRYQDVADWYNGYLFGGEVIYNPWSVLNFVASKDNALRSYWLNTGDTSLIDSLVTRGDRELRGELAQLIEDIPVVRPIYEDIVMRDVEQRDDLLWSFLLFSGYLKCSAQPVRRNWYELRIPNKEVKHLYQALVERWFAKKVTLMQLEGLLSALERGDIRLFERMLRQIVKEVMSYHDLAGEPEKVYQALVLGMLVWLSDKYEIRTNRESGYGRYDIMFKPKQSPVGEGGKQGIIMEFKRVYEDETPEEIMAEALAQINDKAYSTELEAAGITDILRLAVVFRGKELWLQQG